MAKKKKKGGPSDDPPSLPSSSSNPVGTDSVEMQVKVDNVPIDMLRRDSAARPIMQDPMVSPRRDLDDEKTPLTKEDNAASNALPATEIDDNLKPPVGGLERRKTPVSTSVVHLKKMEQKLPDQLRWKDIDKKDLRKAVRDFIQFFDDSDADGSNTISEIELTAGLPKLLPKLRSAEPDTALKIAVKLLTDWASMQGKEHQVIGSRVLDGREDFVLLRELDRQDLLEVLLVALRHPKHDVLGDYGYVIGSYSEQDKTARAVEELAVDFYVILKLVFNHIGYIFWPIYVFFIDLSNRAGGTGVRLRFLERLGLSITSWPLYGAMVYNIYLWVVNRGNVRGLGLVGHLEFYQPFIWMVVFHMGWNVGSYLQGLGFFSRHVIRSKGRHIRFRRLRQLPIEHAHVYVSDSVDPRWVDGVDVGMEFNNAYELYRNIFNVVGFASGTSMPLNLVKSKVLRRSREQSPDAEIVRQLNTRRSAFYYIFSERNNFILNGLCSLVIALIVPLTRELNPVTSTDNGVTVTGKFWARQDLASYFIVGSSILLTWFWSLLVLLQLDHSRQFVGAYAQLFDMLSALISRRRSRVVQLFRVPSLAKKLSPAAFRHLVFPWLPLLWPRNLFAWNEIRACLIEEWAERFHGLRSVMFMTTFVVHIVTGALSLIAVMVSETDVSLDIKWWAFITTLVLYVPLQRFLAAASSINKYERVHLQLLNRVKIRVQMDAILLKEQEAAARRSTDDDLGSAITTPRTMHRSMPSLDRIPRQESFEMAGRNAQGANSGSSTWLNALLQDTAAVLGVRSLEMLQSRTASEVGLLNSNTLGRGGMASSSEETKEQDRPSEPIELRHAHSLPRETLRQRPQRAGSLYGNVSRKSSMTFGAAAAALMHIQKLTAVKQQGDARGFFKLKGDLIDSFIQQIEVGQNAYFEVWGFELGSSFLYTWRSAWFTWFVVVSVNFFLTDVNL